MEFKPNFKGSAKMLVPMILNSPREDLNLISKAVNQRMKQLTELETKSFNKRDRVFFDYQGETIRGTVIRVNKKTITLRSDNDIEWRVSPKFLELEH